MNTKPLTFSLSLTFLFLFSGSVYGDDFQDGMDAANKGDDKEAVRLFRLSAAEGNATAQHNLGYMYAIGQGAPQDYKEAFKWYRIAAEQGLPQAQGQIGHMYIQGMGVKKDFDAAFKWFRLAAEKGDSFSQNSLGVMYAEGIGVGKNDKEALNWFRFAAQNGNEYSIKRLTSLGLWNSADNKPICSREDNEYSLKMDGVEANEAFIFGLKVQQIVREKDLKALFSLVDGELILGPRRSFIKGKEFNDLFSEEWQKKVLETPPECRPVGWRGFMIGHGKIWYRIAHGKLNIFSITGAVEEIPRKQVKEGWLHEGRELEGSCFTTIWYSGDNYEHFHDTYAEAENYQIFSRFIGKYIGKQIPLKAVPSPWDKGTLELAVNLSHCSKTDDEKTYEVLKEIPRTYCKSLAPNFSQECDHIRLIKVSGPCGGSMGCSINTALYAIVDEQKTKNSYMVPLVNFDSENDALNYVDKLIANPPETSAKVVNNEQAHSVVPTEDCSAWTSQKFAGEFIQKNLTIEKSPDKISEKMLYFKKLVENIPNNCLMDFTDSVQFENDKSTTPSLDQKCSVLGSLVALLNTSKINYIRTTTF
jgi:hypothetical protein